jgi:hypothetical protein
MLKNLNTAESRFETDFKTLQNILESKQKDLESKIANLSNELTNELADMKHQHQEKIESISNNIENVKTYNFDYIANNVNAFGCMAHEVKEIYPNLSDGQTVNYIGFIPILLEKVKMLEKEINELKKKIM